MKNTRAQRLSKFENTRNPWMPTNILTFSAKKREFWQNTFPKILHGPKPARFPRDFETFFRALYKKSRHAPQIFHELSTISLVKAKLKSKSESTFDKILQVHNTNNGQNVPFCHKIDICVISVPKIRLFPISKSTRPKFARFSPFLEFSRLKSAHFFSFF